MAGNRALGAGTTCPLKTSPIVREDVLSDSSNSAVASSQISMTGPNVFIPASVDPLYSCQSGLLQDLGQLPSV